MNEPGGAPEQRHHRPKILMTIGAAGAVLSLAAGVVTFLTRAGPEALAATWWVGITSGLVGLVVMISVVAARVGARDEPDSGPGSAPPMDDVDAELFRILADARLGDISPRRLHGRARGTGAG
jgi:hypothetical protein